MKTKDRSPESRSNSLRRVLPWVVVCALVLGVLAVMPSVWALPQQAPDFQTVPTLTPTRPAGATATPTRPAGATAIPTEPGGPTDLLHLVLLRPKHRALAHRLLRLALAHPLLRPPSR